jgi:RNA polymerase sigma-70 factor (ECF subfamily)
VNARIITASDETDSGTEALDLMFRAHYARVARAIGRVIHDQARAEELAVDVFLKWWRHPAAHGDRAEGWIYRTAIRQALDELRRQRRRQRFERLFTWTAPSPTTPEHIYTAADEQQRVREVLGAMRRPHAEALLLRHEGLSYRDVAAALGLNPTYVGSLLARAQDAFRREYEKHHGHER